MASSFFTESEAPRDFRVSSTESDGHYTKCLLCYTVKRNFYCAECIRTGNFVHSSMPYADRYSEKQAKLLRIKANRKYILERCEKLLHPKLRKDTLLTEAKQSQDKLRLLRLAIEQRRNNIEEKRNELAQLKNYNNELQVKLPRYQKRVATLGRHAQHQSMELQNKVSSYNDQVESLAALRRSRIRQLTRFIFPVYMTYDTSDSIEDMEFIGSDTEDEPPRRSQLHIVAPSINTDGDLSNVQTWMRGGEECSEDGQPCRAGSVRAALALCAQLLALLAWTLDVRLPHALPLHEYSSWRVSALGASGRVGRVCACAATLAARAPAPLHCVAHSDVTHHDVTQPQPHPLLALHALTVAAATDHPTLGRVDGWWSGWESGAGAWAAAWGHSTHEHIDLEPEHLCWPDTMELEEQAADNPPTPAPSLVTSAAASLASMWRTWTK